MPKVILKEGVEQTSASPSAPAKSPALAKPHDFDLIDDGEKLVVRDRKSRLLVFKRLANIERGALRRALVKFAETAAILDDIQSMYEYSAAASLASIDGAPYGPWTSVRDLDLRVQTLGDDGVLAYTLLNSLMYDAPTQEEIESVAKKLLKTKK
jgi:hypothetical protein